MLVEAQITINASRPALWSAITDIENAASLIGGVDRIEVLARPASGLVGLRWRETRMLFGKPATAEKWIVEAVENEHYTTRAEDGGFVFLSTKRIAEQAGSLVLQESHESLPQGLKARLKVIPMALFFRGTIRKAILQDMGDIKAAVERR